MLNFVSFKGVNIFFVYKIFLIKQSPLEKNIFFCENRQGIEKETKCKRKCFTLFQLGAIKRCDCDIGN